ncbi:hypothetical protein J6590_061228 [Homalodisca vitripennis]|nr:hypothetical protein J6590_061228 [Homalodisca vitripennis]
MINPVKKVLPGSYCSSNSIAEENNSKQSKCVKYSSDPSLSSIRKSGQFAVTVYSILSSCQTMEYGNRES